MILTLNDSTKTASIQDWDQSDWDLQKDTIPWDYTIEFDPMIDGGILDTIRNDREVHYDQRTIYIQEWIGWRRLDMWDQIQLRHRLTRFLRKQ
jgi:hypothetical protein